MGDYIYSLELESQKYYVGRTRDIATRYQNHAQKLATTWTTNYPVRKLIRLEMMKGPFDEDNEVLRLMMMYGIDSVRGGSYSQVVLSSSEKLALERQLQTAHNLCFRCNKSGHFAANCPESRSTPSSIGILLCIIYT